MLQVTKRDEIMLKICLLFFTLVTSNEISSAEVHVMRQWTQDESYHGQCFTIIGTNQKTSTSKFEHPVVLYGEGNDTIDTSLCPYVIFYGQVSNMANRHFTFISSNLTNDKLHALSQQSLNFLALKKIDRVYKMWRKTPCPPKKQFEFWHPGMSLHVKGIPDLSCVHLRVTTFHTEPFVFWEGSEEPSGGHEVSFFRLIMEYLKFHSYLLSSPKDGGKWGIKEAHGLFFTGAYRDIYEGHTDFAFGHFWLFGYVHDYFGHTNPYSTAPFCFMYRKEPPLPQWMTIYRSLDWYSWLCTGITVTISCLLLMAYTSTRPLSVDPQIKLAHNVLFYVGICFDHPDPVFVSLKSLSARLYVGVNMLCFFLLTHIYIAGYISALALPKQIKPMDTIKQLSESHIDISVPSITLKYLIGTSPDPKLRALSEKGLGVHSHVDDVFKNVASGQLIIGDNRAQLDYYQHGKFFNKNTGQSMVRMVDECIVTFPLVMLLPNQSAYIAFFNVAITQLPKVKVNSTLVLFSLPPTHNILWGGIRRD